jgi:hypothetical protein
MPRANKETSLETRRYVKSALSAAAVDSARARERGEGVQDKGDERQGAARFSGVKGETVKSVR